MFRGLKTLARFLAIFAFLYNKPLLERVLLLKERIYPFSEGMQKQFCRVVSPKSVSIPLEHVNT